MTIKYTKEHEWIKIEGDIATIGITEHAAEALGELVYVELPSINQTFNKGDATVVVESSKSASDVYLPVSGIVTEINESLNSNPENVNSDPYNNGWLIKIRISDDSGLSEAMNAEEYKKYLEENS